MQRPSRRLWLKAAPALTEATDPKGRMALHIACAVKPGGRKLGEPNGIKTVTALLEAGAELEAAVPMERGRRRFPRHAAVVCGLRAARTCRWCGFF